MPTAIEFIADRLPRVTVEDVRRFADTVEIRDAPAFAAELQAFIHERVEAVKLPANLEGETVEQALARKAARCAPKRAGPRLKPTSSEAAPCCWNPSTSRTTCRSPSTPSWRTSRASRSTGDILARRLLALNGPRGQKLPDWQLDPVKQQLTQTVLQEVEGIDHWTIYRALSEPLEGLGGRSPVDAVTHGTPMTWPKRCSTCWASRCIEARPP